MSKFVDIVMAELYIAPGNVSELTRRPLCRITKMCSNHVASCLRRLQANGLAVMGPTRIWRAAFPSYSPAPVCQNAALFVRAKLKVKPVTVREIANDMGCTYDYAYKRLTLMRGVMCLREGRRLKFVLQRG